MGFMSWRGMRASVQWQCICPLIPSFLIPHISPLHAHHTRSEGTFKLELFLPSEYPMAPPKVCPFASSLGLHGTVK